MDGGSDIQKKAKKEKLAFRLAAWDDKDGRRFYDDFLAGPEGLIRKSWKELMRENPNKAKEMLAQVPDRYRLEGTGFTKITVALNNPTPVHKDSNNVGATFLVAWEIVERNKTRLKSGSHVITNEEHDSVIVVKDSPGGVVLIGDYRKILHANLGVIEGERLICTCYASQALVNREAARVKEQQQQQVEEQEGQQQEQQIDDDEMQVQEQQVEQQQEQQEQEQQVQEQQVEQQQEQQQEQQIDDDEMQVQEQREQQQEQQQEQQVDDDEGQVQEQQEQEQQVQEQQVEQQEGQVQVEDDEMQVEQDDEMQVEQDDDDDNDYEIQVEQQMPIENEDVYDKEVYGSTTVTDDNGCKFFGWNDATEEDIRWWKSPQLKRQSKYWGIRRQDDINRWRTNLIQKRNREVKLEG